LKEESQEYMMDFQDELFGRDRRFPGFGGTGVVHKTPETAPRDYGAEEDRFSFFGYGGKEITPGEFAGTETRGSLEDYYKDLGEEELGAFNR
jgi:hypothetical protein